MYSIKQSRRLIQTVYHSLTNNSPYFEKCLQSSFCTKIIPKEANKSLDFEGEEDTDIPTMNNQKNYDSTIVDKSDVFGNLRFSLEKQKRSKTSRSRISKSDKEDSSKISTKRNYRRINPKHFDDSDRFGDLSSETHYFSVMDDPEPGDDSTVFYPERKYKSPEAYLDEMKNLVKQKKLKEALELFPDMKKNHVFPIHGNYTFMIGACGKAGYTEMAFKLLRQMTDRGFRPSPATLTGLFNSCAECPFPEYGLKKAKFLKEKSLEKNWVLTQPTYHAMIKSFGKCGDIQTSFEIVDEMIAAGIKPECSTYNFLLMSCIADKDAGFTHSIEVWRKMLSKRIKPHLFTFNLLLRAVRDCAVGPEEISALLIQHWSSYTKRPYGLSKSDNSTSNEMLKLPNPEFAIGIESGCKDDSKQLNDDSAEPKGTSYAKNFENVSDGHSVSELSQNNSLKSVQVVPKVLPNILSKRPVTGVVFSDILSVKTAPERLALLGNAESFLHTMKSFKVQPDIKTFMLLLENLPPHTESEDNLISLMDMHNVKPDVDFFNMLIKRRNMRNDFTSARKALLLINKYDLTPDIVTFGVLALNCKKSKHGMNLLEEMKKLGFHPNVEIMGALINSACLVWDFNYMKLLMSEMKNLDVKPNERILTMLENIVQNARHIVIQSEQGKEVTIPYEGFHTAYQQFNDFYVKWLKSIEVDMDKHPWQQYETDIIYREDRK